MKGFMNAVKVYIEEKDLQVCPNILKDQERYKVVYLQSRFVLKECYAPKNSCDRQNKLKGAGQAKTHPFNLHAPWEHLQNWL